MTTRLTDIALFHLIKEDSMEAFTALYMRYWEELYGYAWKILEDKAPVEDILQELFLHIWDRRKRLNIDHHVKAYLYKSLKNRIYNFLKANAVKNAHYEALFNSMSLLAEEDVTIDRKDYIQRLLCHLEALPGKMRAIARLYLLEGHNIKEISDQLSLSEHTVRNQLANVKRRLLRK